MWFAVLRRNIEDWLSFDNCGWVTDFYLIRSWNDLWTGCTGTSDWSNNPAGVPWVIATGGNVPADQALAATIAIPIALQTGMSAEVAVGLAVPFGVLGVFVDQIRRTSNSVWGRWADKFAEKGDRKGIFRCAIIYPAIFGFCLRFIPVFAINLVGAEAVSWLMGVLPQWIITGFSVAGGLLPALGFAIIIITIGRKDLLAYFFIGFFAVAYLGINTMAAAVFGGCIAVLVTINARKNKKGAAA